MNIILEEEFDFSKYMAAIYHNLSVLKPQQILNL